MSIRASQSYASTEQRWRNLVNALQVLLHHYVTLNLPVTCVMVVLGWGVILHRKSSITVKEELPTLLASSNVGTCALTFDDEDILRLLRTAIEREGNISAFAKRHGLERTNLTNVLNGKRPVSSSLAKHLGLRKVYTR